MKKIVPILTCLTVASVLTSCGTPNESLTRSKNGSPMNSQPVTKTPQLESPALMNRGSGSMTATGKMMQSGAMEPNPAPTPVSANTSVIHTSTVSYGSPAGKEDITLAIVVEGGKISSITATPLATNPISSKFQTGFAAGIAKAAVGKDIASLSLKAVAGASLTTGAFNEYVKTF